MNNQSSLDKSGFWEEVSVPKPDNLVSLEVGESFVGVFVSRVENEVYDGFVYTLERENGDLATMYSTTNLDFKMKLLESGDRIKISRSDDKPMKPPKKPLQIYSVQRWVKKEDS